MTAFSLIEINFNELRSTGLPRVTDVLRARPVPGQPQHEFTLRRQTLFCDDVNCQFIARLEKDSVTV